MAVVKNSVAAPHNEKISINRKKLYKQNQTSASLNRSYKAYRSEGSPIGALSHLQRTLTITFQASLPARRLLRVLTIADPPPIIYYYSPKVVINSEITGKQTKKAWTSTGGGKAFI